MDKNSLEMFFYISGIPQYAASDIKGKSCRDLQN